MHKPKLLAEFCKTQIKLIITHFYAWQMKSSVVAWLTTDMSTADQFSVPSIFVMEIYRKPFTTVISQIWNLLWPCRYGWYPSNASYAITQYLLGHYSGKNFTNNNLTVSLLLTSMLQSQVLVTRSFSMTKLCRENTLQFSCL